MLPAMRKGEIRSLSEIAAGSLAQPGVTAREVHTAVSDRVFGMLGPLGAPIRVLHDGISAASYRGVTAAIRAPVSVGGRLIAGRAREGSTAIADSPAGGLALGALNGIAGDRLARDHPDLALDLTVRRHGHDVPLSEDGLSEAFPDATPRLAVFVHGLCGTEDTWRLGSLGENPSPSYGARLRDELGLTAVYVRYNTGLRVSDNGRRLAVALDRIAADWPVEVEEITLVGHSMGGLVARSACHYGEQAGQSWTEPLRHVFCLGTPHLGAPLERAANVAGWTLSRLPESRPFADLFFNRRSVGIKDMRYGNCVEEDWCDCDPDEFLRDRCREVPFLPTATYYFVGATLTKRPGGLGRLVGDLLVQYPSASGDGRRRRIPFEVDNGHHLGGAHHLRLLNHPDVYAQIRDWIVRSTASPSGRATGGRPT
jgi:pimeloyl-ACP methyl ester carboxylesterase